MEELLLAEEDEEDDAEAKSIVEADFGGELFSLSFLKNARIFLIEGFLNKSPVDLDKSSMLFFFLLFFLSPGLFLPSTSSNFQPLSVFVSLRTLIASNQIVGAKL